MKKKIILRLSNEIGNQMFMYASAYSLAKKMNRELFLDNETAFLRKQNISKYGLNNFKISSSIVEDKFKFKNLNGYLRRKIILKTDFLRTKKKFYIEKKDKNKITKFDENFINESFDENLYLEGHYESPKYFDMYTEEIKQQFRFVKEAAFNQIPIYEQINNSKSIGICIRQNRFNEGVGRDSDENIKRSENYSKEQIRYINKSVDFIRNKVPDSKFYLWSNDYSNIKNENFNFDVNFVDTSKYENNLDIRALNLFLLSKCKHFIVTPSTFSWWGAWLGENKNSIILRPNPNFFSLFKVNNLDFWPKNWIELNE